MVHAQWDGDATFALLFESVPDAMVGVDRTGAVRFVNRQTELLFGYGRDELIGQPIEVLVPKASRQAHARYRATAHPRVRPMGSGRQLFGLRRDGTTATHLRRSEPDRVAGNAARGAGLVGPQASLRLPLICALLPRRRSCLASARCLEPTNSGAGN